MYTNPQNGQATAGTVAPTLSTYRRDLIALLGASPVITTAEYEVAACNIATCQSLATLQKWYRNCIREIARREEEVLTPAPVEYATASQKEELHRLCNSVHITRPEKTRVLRNINQFDHAAAKAEIDQLWATIASRSTSRDYPVKSRSLAVGPDGALSFSDAA